jgi:hypothetical protein
MKARTAVVELLKAEPEWRQFLKRCCEAHSLRLRSQVGQWRDELADRGHNFSPTDVEDALMDLARRFFPESPGAQWDGEWASKYCRDSLARLGEYYAGLGEDERDRLDLSGQDPHEEAMLRAGEDNDPAAFRLALASWERAGVEAFERARSRDMVAS